MPYATVFNKGGTDKTVVMNVRTFLAQPMQATEWRDLRIGFLLSLTTAGDNDTTTGLGETIGVSRGLLGWNDRYRIGLTDRLTGTIFLGYSNRSFEGGHPNTSGQSILLSSDGGIGTTNANFWRPKNELSDLQFYGQIVDNDATRVMDHDGDQIHFAQDPIGAGGYATLLMIRLQREDAGPHAKIITMSLKNDIVNHNGDVIYTNTPTKDLIQNEMADFPASAQTFGPVSLSQVPDTIFLYWPFHNSRLRIHCMGILKNE